MRQQAAPTVVVDDYDDDDYDDDNDDNQTECTHLMNAPVFSLLDDSHKKFCIFFFSLLYFHRGTLPVCMVSTCVPKM